MKRDQQSQEHEALPFHLLGLHDQPRSSPLLADLLHNLASANPNPLVLTDSLGKVLYINQATVDFFDYAPQELLSSCMSLLFAADNWEHLYNTCQKLIAHPREKRTPTLHRTTVVSKQALAYFAEITISCLPSVGDNRFFVFMFGDIKERDNSNAEAREDAAQQAQRLRLQAIGRLTTGLAHEYNNLLTSIVGYSDILSARLCNDDASSRYLKHIAEASSKAADLTRHLIAFSRHRTYEPEICDLNTVLSDMGKMIQGLFDDDIKVSMELAPNLGMISIDLGELLQVLVMVLSSLREDVASRGRISIATNRAQNFSASQLNPVVGLYAMLSIGYEDEDGDNHSADGPSPTEMFHLKQMQAELEEAFKLVHKAGGHTEVATKPTHGRMYKIFFPISQLPSTHNRSIDVVKSSRSSSSTILIVDDEDLIRALIREALILEGYRVLEAESPKEALALSKKYEHPIDLLVSDVVMPGMNGRQLADKLVDERPHLRLLFISGHSVNLLMRNGIDDLDGRFLQKPFSTSCLLEKVRSALTLT